MNRRNVLRSLSAILILSAFSAPGWSSPRTTRLTILHTNDTHGHLRPFSYPSTFDAKSELASLTRFSPLSNIGGIARRAALARKIRAEKGHATLLVDAGDICDGTPFSTEYHGRADIEAMNAAGYDLACPGNHEFSNSAADARALVALARFPVLSANVVDRGDGSHPFGSSEIRTIDGIRVAFLGLLTPEANAYRAGKDSFTVQPPAEIAARMVPELRKQADLVVLLSHLGLESDKRLAADVPGIDIIVGGHSHSMLRRPLFVTNSSAPAGSLGGTIIAQDFQWGGSLGRLDLTITRTDQGSVAITKYSGQLLPVTSALTEDPATAAAVAARWTPIASTYGEALGIAAADFTRVGDDHAEYNLLADAVRKATGAEIDIENMGGVRSALVRGPITYEDLVAMDPFGNTIFRLEMTGRQIMALLARERPAVSGLRYEIQAGQLIAASTVGDGKPIDPERVYSVATNSFFVRSAVFNDARSRIDTGKKRLDALVDYIRAANQQPMRPALDGRRKLRRTE